MKENYLHYLWKNKLISTTILKCSTSSQSIKIKSFGEHNTNAGPDFLNASIIYDRKEWHGSIEIHVRSSDWKLHGHSSDPKYQNVILHIVWEHDQELNLPFPTVELKEHTNYKSYEQYLSLISSPTQFIACENSISTTDSFKNSVWLKRIGIQRIENKVDAALRIHKEVKGDYEHTLLILISMALGAKVNYESMKILGLNLNTSILLKERHQHHSIDALLFGVAGFLDATTYSDNYPTQLQTQFGFLKHKYKLTQVPHTIWNFLRLRPQSFPTVRIAQLSAIIAKNYPLGELIVQCKTLKEIKSIFNITLHSYWEKHYHFHKESSKGMKSLSSERIDLIIINAIVPFLFLYSKNTLKPELKEFGIELLEQLKPEKNKIVSSFNQLLDTSTQNAMESQAILELYKKYCVKKKCLECQLGYQILNKK